jgi:hypothetical protein
MKDEGVPLVLEVMFRSGEGSKLEYHVYVSNLVADIVAVYDEVKMATYIIKQENMSFM